MPQAHDDADAGAAGGGADAGAAGAGDNGAREQLTTTESQSNAQSNAQSNLLTEADAMIIVGQIIHDLCHVHRAIEHIGFVTGSECSVL